VIETVRCVDGGTTYEAIETQLLGVPQSNDVSPNLPLSVRKRGYFFRIGVDEINNTIFLSCLVLLMTMNLPQALRILAVIQNSG